MQADLKGFQKLIKKDSGIKPEIRESGRRKSVHNIREGNQVRKSVQNQGQLWNEGERTMHKTIQSLRPRRLSLDQNLSNPRIAGGIADESTSNLHF